MNYEANELFYFPALALNTMSNFFEAEKSIASKQMNYACRKTQDQTSKRLRKLQTRLILGSEMLRVISLAIPIRELSWRSCCKSCKQAPLL